MRPNAFLFLAPFISFSQLWSCRGIFPQPPAQSLANSKHADAVQFLCKKARNAFKACQRPHILIIGAPDTMTETVREDLTLHGMAPVVLSLADFLRDGLPGAERYACVICTYTDIRRTTAAARAVLADARLSHLTFEYVTFPAASYPFWSGIKPKGPWPRCRPCPPIRLTSLNSMKPRWNISRKNVTSAISWISSQLLKTVRDNAIDGDVAEFGSYRGTAGI